jgi:hypothetical protein
MGKHGKQKQPVRGPSVVGLLLKGLLFHLVFIGTVFDCYFTSPVVNGMRGHKLTKGEAKRLVLIVGPLQPVFVPFSLTHFNKATGFGRTYSSTSTHFQISPALRKLLPPIFGLLLVREGHLGSHTLVCPQRVVQVMLPSSVCEVVEGKLFSKTQLF